MFSIRVDLPEPETPVTTVRTPIGKRGEMSFKLCCRAPFKIKLGVLAFIFLRVAVALMRSRPLK